MSAVLWGGLGGIATFVIMAALGDMVSEEIRDRLDHLPHAILRLAARQLDETERVILYEEVWLPDLAYILKGDEARPVTRLVVGTWYAVGILFSATQSARHLQEAKAKASVGKDGPAPSAHAAIRAQHYSMREKIVQPLPRLMYVCMGACFAILPIGSLFDRPTTFDYYSSPVAAVILWMLCRRASKLLKQLLRAR
jgi:hypothetical protein